MRTTLWQLLSTSRCVALEFSPNVDSASPYYSREGCHAVFLTVNNLGVTGSTTVYISGAVPENCGGYHVKALMNLVSLMEAECKVYYRIILGVS